MHHSHTVYTTQRATRGKENKGLTAVVTIDFKAAGTRKCQKDMFFGKRQNSKEPEEKHHHMVYLPQHAERDLRC
jgi:hypothetical protein